MPVVSIYKTLDPIYSLLEIHGFIMVKNPETFFIIALRYSLMQPVCLEMTRTAIIIFGPVLPFCDVYIRCLKELLKLPKSQVNLQRYKQLQFINQVGRNVALTLAAAVMASVLISLVAGNWAMISGWNALPITVYFAVVGLTFTEYFVIFQTISKLSHVNDLSSKILQKWKRDTGRSFYWKRIIKSQMPIAFYYGLAKFDKDTSMNYGSHIVDYTVNILMLQR